MGVAASCTNCNGSQQDGVVIRRGSVEQYDKIIQMIQKGNTPKLTKQQALKLLEMGLLELYPNVVKFAITKLGPSQIQGRKKYMMKVLQSLNKDRFKRDKMMDFLVDNNLHSPDDNRSCIEYLFRHYEEKDKAVVRDDLIKLCGYFDDQQNMDYLKSLCFPHEKSYARKMKSYRANPKAYGLHRPSRSELQRAAMHIRWDIIEPLEDYNKALRLHILQKHRKSHKPLQQTKSSVRDPQQQLRQGTAKMKQDTFRDLKQYMR